MPVPTFVKTSPEDVITDPKQQLQSNASKPLPSPEAALQDGGELVASMKILSLSDSSKDVKPEAAIPRPIPTLQYSEMAQISRTMHFHLYQTSRRKKQFLSSPVTVKYMTVLPRNGQFVWFRAMPTDGSGEHDWFGNVRCSLDLLDLLKNDRKINMFLADCAYFGCSSATRILLTHRKKIPDGRLLTLNNLNYGDPIVMKDGKLMFLSKDVSNNMHWCGNHQTEFVFDLRTISSKILFKMSKIEAVSHDGANKKDKNGRFITHRCLIYNSSRRECPSSWCKEYTDLLLAGTDSNKLPYERFMDESRASKKDFENQEKCHVGSERKDASLKLK